jgi:hypothetical protein
LSILDMLDDPRLFAGRFSGPSWQAWRVVLKGLFSLPMSRQEFEVFRAITDWDRMPSATDEMLREGWIIAGRRAGKSIMMALIAVYLAFFRDWKQSLTLGERGVGMLLAADRDQATVIKGYIEGLIDSVPALAKMVSRRRTDALHLSNGVSIEVHTSNFRKVRGRSLIFAVCDETAFWWSDEASANPDVEVISALRPSLVTTRGPLLVISSPHARRGAVYETWKRQWGKTGGRVLVIRGESRLFNPTIPAEDVERALEEDPDRARAEWLAEFRRDVETYVSREALEAVTAAGRFELPPLSEHQYFAFVDPALGSGMDSMCLAIAHVEQRDGRVIAVLDAIRERRPPFNPDSVVAEFAETVKQYRIATEVGDRVGGEFVREPFRKLGIEYVIADRVKSELYRAFLALSNSGRVELLDHARLLGQLGALERRAVSGGREVIDHPLRAHDDVANCVAGALLLAAESVTEEPAIVAPLVIPREGVTAGAPHLGQPLETPREDSYFPARWR